MALYVAPSLEIVEYRVDCLLGGVEAGGEFGRSHAVDPGETEEPEVGGAQARMTGGGDPLKDGVFNLFVRETKERPETGVALL